MGLRPHCFIKENMNIRKTPTKIRHYYEVEIRLDMSTISDTVGDFMSKLNDTMHSFGVNEETCLMSGPIKVQITSERKLDTDEQSVITSEVRKVIKEQMLNYKPVISHMRYIGVNTVKE